MDIAGPCLGLSIYSQLFYGKVNGLSLLGTPWFRFYVAFIGLDFPNKGTNQFLWDQSVGDGFWATNSTF